MDERAALLKQLSIDRDDEAPSPRRTWRWWLAGASLAGAAAAAGWLALAPSAEGPSREASRGAAPLAVEAATAARSAPAALEGSTLDASGYVVARRQATVSAKITGKVVEVSIEEGQHVDAGQVLARLDDANARAQRELSAARLEQARATLTAANVDFENATSIFERNESLHASEIISAQTFDTAKASYDASRAAVGVARRAVEVAEADLALAEQNLDDTIVRAPFAGVVTVKAAQEGEMVSPVTGGGGFTRTGIGTIVDMDSLEVEVDVSENFINRVHAEQGVAVTLNAYPDWRIPGSVIAIIPTADRAKATVTVRIALDERDERIVPEMGVRVAFLNSHAGK